MERRPLGPSNPNPRADTCEFFQGNGSLRALGLGDNFLADPMVEVGREASLLASTLPIEPARGARPLAGELRPQAAVPRSQVLHVSARVALPVTVAGEVDDPQVDPEHIFGLALGWFEDLDGSEEIPVSVPVEEVALALPGGKERAGAFVAGEIDGATAFHRPDRDAALSPAEDAVIISNRTVTAEEALGVTIALVGVGHLGDGTDEELGSEGEAGTKIVVAGVLESIAAEGAGGDGQFADGIGGVIGAFEGGQEDRVVVWTDEEFDADGQFHAGSMPEFGRSVKK
jgi:hypothetical protein